MVKGCINPRFLFLNNYVDTLLFDEFENWFIKICQHVLLSSAAPHTRVHPFYTDERKEFHNPCSEGIHHPYFSLTSYFYPYSK